MITGSNCLSLRCVIERVPRMCRVYGFTSFLSSLYMVGKG